MDKVHEIPIFFVHLLQTRNLIVYLGQKKMVQILKVLSLVKHHNWNQVGLSTCQLQGVHAIATHWSTPPSSVPSEASLVLTLSLSLTHTVTFSPGRPTETKPAAAVSMFHHR